jgi:hypothetical protein
VTEEEEAREVLRLGDRNGIEAWIAGQLYRREHEGWVELHLGARAGGRARRRLSAGPETSPGGLAGEAGEEGAVWHCPA